VSEAIRLYSRETVKTGRYAVIGAELATARRVWFVLHGYGQLAADILRPFEGVVPADTCVVAPEGLSRFYRDMPRPDGSHLQRVGATWMTRESREDDITDTVRWLQNVHDTVMAEAQQATAIGVLAFSQGVATATRWLAAGDVRLQHWVAWAGGLATDIDHERLRGQLTHTRVTLVVGDADPFVSEEALQVALERLQSWQPTASAQRFSGSHRLDASVLGALLDGLGVSS
jgi:predicted esterase